MNTTQKDIEIIRGWACSPLVGEKVKQALAKLIKRIKELEAEAKMGNIPYKEAIALKKENEKLKAKLKRSSKGCTCGNRIVMGTGDPDFLPCMHCGKPKVKSSKRLSVQEIEEIVRQSVNCGRIEKTALKNGKKFQEDKYVKAKAEEIFKGAGVRQAYIPTNLRRYTFQSPKIKKWVEGRCVGRTLNLFAGKTKLAINEYRVDVDVDALADSYIDAYEFVKNCKDKYDTVLLDPPYAYRKAMEMYNGNYSSKFKLIADELVRISDRVISFGYHSTFMGKVRGYKLEELCVFGHGGAQHCTIAIIERYKH